MYKRKHIFTSILLVIILAFAMVGCKKTNDEEQTKEMVNVSDIITSSVNQLMNKDSFSMNLSLKEEKDYKNNSTDLSLKVLKTETGYDFEMYLVSDNISFGEDEDGAIVPVEEEKDFYQYYKIGNLLYEKYWSNYELEDEDFNLDLQPYQVMYTTKLDNDISFVKNYIEPVLPNVKNLMDILNNSNKLEKNDEGYSISFGKDYTEDLKAFLTELKTNENTQAVKYFIDKCVDAGYNINLQNIKDAINTVCNDEVTMDTAIKEVNKLIKIFVPELSIKDIVNDICSIAGLNAEEVYNQYIKDTDLEETFTAEPTENQTVYDYIYDTAKDKAILPILKNVLDDDDFSLNDFKEDALDALDDETFDVKSAVDEILSNTTSILEKIPEISNIDLDYDFVYDFDTFVNMNVEKTVASLVSEFDSNYNLNQLKLDLASKSQTNDETPIAFSNFSLNLNLDLNYDAVTIDLPENMILEPYIESDDFYINDIQDNMENGVTVKYNKMDYTDCEVNWIWSGAYISRDEQNVLKNCITIDKDKSEIIFSKEFFVTVNALAEKYPGADMGITFKFNRDASETVEDDQICKDLSFYFYEYEFSFDFS